MNPIAISLGPLEIRWYAIFILSGFIDFLSKLFINKKRS